MSINQTPLIPGGPEPENQKKLTEKLRDRVVFHVQGVVDKIGYDNLPDNFIPCAIINGVILGLPGLGYYLGKDNGQNFYAIMNYMQSLFK